MSSTSALTAAAFHSRSSSASRAALGSLAARISLMIASMLATAMARATSKRARARGLPLPLQQRVARGVGVLGGADQLDDRVDVGDRDGEAPQQVGAVARLLE